MEREGNLPFFETKRYKGRVIYRLFAVTIFVGICLIWSYRVSNIPKQAENERWVWIGLLGAELWFGFYWIFTQALQWNRVYRRTYKDRLSQRSLFYYVWICIHLYVCVCLYMFSQHMRTPVRFYSENF